MVAGGRRLHRYVGGVGRAWSQVRVPASTVPFPVFYAAHGVPARNEPRKSAARGESRKFRCREQIVNYDSRRPVLEPGQPAGRGRAGTTPGRDGPTGINLNHSHSATAATAATAPRSAMHSRRVLRLLAFAPSEPMLRQSVTDYRLPFHTLVSES